MLVVCLPALVLLATGLVTQSRLGIASGAVATVLSGLAGQLGRDRGRALQPALWRSWGGSPTLRRLRYRDASDEASVARRHARIVAVLGDTLPTRTEEAEDEAAAASRYEDAVERLQALTRPRDQFPLVFEENANYGQRRNLLGLRGVGAAVAAATLVVAVALFIFTSGAAGTRAGRYAPAAGTALLLLGFWWRVVTPGWVRVPAEAYADQLLQAVEVIRRAA